AEDMAYCIFLAELIEVWVEIFRFEVEVLVKKSAQIGRAVAGMGDHLHAIAGGDDHALLDSGMSGKIAAAIGQARLRNREALAHFERGALVIHADELVSHEAANLWMVEK